MPDWYASSGSGACLSSGEGQPPCGPDLPQLILGLFQARATHTANHQSIWCLFNNREEQTHFSLSSSMEIRLHKEICSSEGFTCNYLDRMISSGVALVKESSSKAVASSSE